MPKDYSNFNKLLAIACFLVARKHTRSDAGSCSGTPSGSNCFDTPRLHPAYNSNSCYLGCTLAVALAETVPRDEQLVDGRFSFALSALALMHPRASKGATCAYCLDQIVA
jgi:hypothetical protein